MCLEYLVPSWWNLGKVYGAFGKQSLAGGGVLLWLGFVGIQSSSKAVIRLLPSSCCGDALLSSQN